MRRFFTWWRREKHERELFTQLRGMPDISPAHIETEVTTLLRGLFHHDVVIQNRCLELLRKASSRRVAQALCSHLESGWPDSLPRRGAKTTKGYQKAVELLSGEQNQDSVLHLGFNCACVRVGTIHNPFSKGLGCFVCVHVFGGRDLHLVTSERSSSHAA